MNKPLSEVVKIDLSVHIDTARPTMVEIARWLAEDPIGRACMADMRTTVLRHRPAREIAALMEIGRQVIAEHPEIEPILLQMRAVRR